MTALTPRRREALQAVKDGQVTFRDPVDGFPPDFYIAKHRTQPVPFDWAEREGLIHFDWPATQNGPVRLTPAGENALQGKEATK